MEENSEIKICQLSRQYLRLTLIWPDKGEEFNPSKRFYLKALIFFLLVVLPVIALLLCHLTLCIQVGGIDVSEDLALLASLFGLTIMMTLFILNGKKIALLLKDLSDFENFGKPPRFDEINAVLKYCPTFVFAYAIFGTVVYNLFKIYNISSCRKFRKVWESCGAIVPLWLPYPADNFFILSLIIIYVFISIITVDRGTLIISSQITEIAYNIKLRIDHLNSLLLTCFDRSAKDSRQQLNYCIRYHIALIDYCTRFNDCYTYVMFVYLATAGIIFGCLENQVIKQLDLGAILHFFGWMSALSLCCFSGQVVMDSTTSVAEAAYNCKWYNADVNLQKDLILIIIRSQKALFISTGPFNVLSFALFVSIMKLSYSIMTLLG